MARIGIGVIGCGDISRARYFPAIAALPEFELRGLQNRTAAACEPLAQQYGGKIYADVGTLLRAPEIEAVVIATPHPSHAELALQCIAAGKHVLCEKPMTTSLDDARRIAAAVATSSVAFMALPFDASPAIAEGKRLIESGAIGQVTSTDSVLAHMGPKHAPWFFDKDKAQWGVLADLAVYLFSQLTYLFGPASTVRGSVGTSIPNRVSASGETIAVTVDDNVAAILEWPDRSIATIRANWCSPSDHRNVICETRIYGTKGLTFINPASKTNPLVVFSPGGAISGATALEYNGMSDCYAPALAAWDGDRGIMSAFAARIRGETGGYVASAARQLHVIEIIERLYAASETGAAVKLGV
jgi:UDP-N-acetylglucosamine 3-dehydrogenase